MVEKFVEYSPNIADYIIEYVPPPFRRMETEFFAEWSTKWMNDTSNMNVEKDDDNTPNLPFIENES